MNKEQAVEKLNAKKAEERLDALRAIKKNIGEREEGNGYTNNHVHSTYSFSPYTPSRIVYEACKAGLNTVGIMDHDSISGAKEFIEAGKIMGIATTVGFEVRTDWADTPFANVRLNNPDQIGCAYICVHGVPHQNIDRADEFLSKIRNARNQRNIKMVEQINKKLKGISLNFDEDVKAISLSDEGGSITERHILFALGRKIAGLAGTRINIVKYLEGDLNIRLSRQQRQYIEDEKNSLYAYDLLNILKGNFVCEMYMDAQSPEILPIKEVLDFVHQIGAIPAYAYLGDVKGSATGDKKDQVFEDSYIEELLDFCKKIGFDAAAYMPSRNTKDQLAIVKGLCRKNELFQISGEDINQPRQSFICEKLMDQEYIHLIDTTWALVGHELMASRDITLGMFAEKNQGIKLDKRVEDFASRAFKIYNN